MPRATKAQKNSRTRAVYEMILSDVPRAEMLRYAAKNWAIKARTVDDYIAWANELIEAESASMQTEAFALHLVKLKMMRHRALQAGDMRLGFDILRDLAKIQNLYPPKERRIQHIDIDLSLLTDEQLQRIAQGEDPLQVVAAQGVNNGT